MGFPAGILAAFDGAATAAVGGVEEGGEDTGAVAGNFSGEIEDEDGSRGRIFP